ncbi:imidazole glycerol phosphate synthase subunit HisH [Synechococcus sp. MVIR-18-1]|uniref:imidazole glycerol phosphate synthase subunit HisH n=1 Tax=Synechococcus sp. MVIR-18-1 TaxID=1386941 RepID=UPI00164732E2|nr:imidazole glycerol phosphate synthase subunit HisH [Synechococcus sp. MVIR-18-1]QNI75225.1 imidazole glycerol phosphate synthase subunit hisH protein family [Synechococcus sp. MVIR-18-1]
MITIVDYGMGNIGSMVNMFKKIGVNAVVESSASKISLAEKLVLPGVGAFDAAMDRINSISGLRDALDRKALVDQIPILGVCLGMQLFTDSSEEGALSGLGWIPGSTHRFPSKPLLKVPHMGWNLTKINSSTPLTYNIVEKSRYYFVHSYFVLAANPDNCLMKTEYGVEFHSAIHRDNIFGVQFHPEKSHRFGMQLLKNFAEIAC